MAGEADDDPETPSRRRPSISTQTYEALSDFKVTMTRVEGKLDAVADTLGRHDAVHKDHESRLRVLEGQLTGYLAGAAAAVGARTAHIGTAQWVFGAAITLITTALGLVTFFHKS